MIALTAKREAFLETGLRGDAKRSKSAEKTIVGGKGRCMLSGPRTFHLSARERGLNRRNELALCHLVPASSKISPQWHRSKRSAQVWRLDVVSDELDR